MSPSPMQPPISPSIAAQQMPPMAMYAQQAYGMGGNGSVNGAGDQSMGGQSMGGDPTAAAMGLVQSLLTSVGNELEKVAKVIVTVKPELTPLLKQAVNALSMVMNEATKSLQPTNGAAADTTMPPASAAVSAGA